MEEQSEIRKRLRDAELDIARLQSHIQSEFGNHSRQLNDLNRENKELRGFKDNLTGQITILKVVAGAAIAVAVSVIAAVIIWLTKLKA